jgi:hypothetical protein
MAENLIVHPNFEQKNHNGVAASSGSMRVKRSHQDYESTDECSQMKQVKLSQLHSITSLVSNPSD